MLPVIESMLSSEEKMSVLSEILNKTLCDNFLKEECGELCVYCYRGVLCVYRVCKGKSKLSRKLILLRLTTACPATPTLYLCVSIQYLTHFVPCTMGSAGAYCQYL